uniref:Uncharacterized protein n=1 Tax=Rhodosorus marinus TaxID=101924 RepID=A0A7S2Z922_9RHOD
MDQLHTPSAAVYLGRRTSSFDSGLPMSNFSESRSESSDSWTLASFSNLAFSSFRCVYQKTPPRASATPEMPFTSKGLPKRMKSERMITQVLPCPKILYVNADDFPMTRNMDTFTRNAIKPVKNIND